MGAFNRGGRVGAESEGWKRKADGRGGVDGRGQRRGMSEDVG